MSTYTLTGTGTQTLSANVTAFHISLTGLPASPDQGNANPANVFGYAMLRIGDATGWMPAIPVEAAAAWLPVPNGATRIGYACLQSTGLTVVEVIGGTPPFGLPAGSLAGLTDVALASLADAQVLTYQASSSKWINATPAGGGGGITPAVLLNYRAASDLATSLSVPSNTFVNLGPSNSFTVTATRPLLISAGGLAFGFGGGANCDFSWALVIDSTRYMMGGSWTPGQAQNFLAGGGLLVLSSLSVASHTAQVQIRSTTSCSCNCRPSTVPNEESLYVSVIQN